MHCAEAVMLHTINSIERKEVDIAALLYRSVCLAIRGRCGAPDLKLASSSCDSTTLPIELRSVIRLPFLLRCCFVLHFLLELPRDTSAGLLRMDANQVNEMAAAAAWQLAAMQEQAS
jgi:hypothetical protein